MDKKQAAGIIIKSADVYERTFNHKHLLIIFGNDKQGVCNQLDCLEIMMDEKRFLHLTGVEINPNAPKLSPFTKSKEDFYYKAQKGVLTEDDFFFKDDIHVEKLYVLENILTAKNLRFIGEYNHSHPNLQAEKMAGNTKACLGFDLDENGRYIIRTVLSEDVRDVTFDQAKVLSVLNKYESEFEYRTFVYLAKGLYARGLLEAFKEKFPDIPLEPQDVNYDSLLPNQREYNEKCDQEKEITNLIKLLTETRSEFAGNQNMETLSAYLKAQDKFTEYVDQTHRYDFAREMLKRQLPILVDSKELELSKCIKDEIKRVQERQEKYNSSPIGGGTVTLCKIRRTSLGEFVFVDTLPNKLMKQIPKDPIKTLYYKARDTVLSVINHFKKDKSTDPNNGGSGNPDGGGSPTPTLSKETPKENEPVKVPVQESVVQQSIQSIVSDVPNLSVSEQPIETTPTTNNMQEQAISKTSLVSDAEPRASAEVPKAIESSHKPILQEPDKASERAKPLSENKPKKKKQIEYGD